MASTGSRWLFNKYFGETKQMKQYVIRTKTQNADTLLPECVIDPSDPQYAECYPQVTQIPDTGVGQLPDLNVSVVDVGGQDDQV
jgi:hypothetical protein